MQLLITMVLILEGKKVTLSGDKALDYVRSRKETGAAE